MKKLMMLKNKNYLTFFEHKECKFYKCHKMRKINCIFCFCPLYTNANCHGSYVLIKGIKDCSKCIFPHTKKGGKDIMLKLKRG